MTDNKPELDMIIAQLADIIDLLQLILQQVKK